MQMTVALYAHKYSDKEGQICTRNMQNNTNYAINVAQEMHFNGCHALSPNMTHIHPNNQHKIWFQ